MTKRIFLFSDAHHGHKEIEEFEQRNSGFEKKIRKRWNSVVEKDDLVIDLGDFYFGGEKLIHYTSKLNGTKALVKGNHDNKSITYYLENGFSFVCDEFKLVDYYGYSIVFSHIPLEVVPDGFVNIHGHLHSGIHRPNNYTNRHFLFNPEKDGYNLTPRLLKTFLKDKEKFTN